MAKRNLTENEIEFILDFIQPNPRIPEKTAEIIVNNAKKTLKTQLVSIQIYPEMIGELKYNIEKMYKNSLVQPGESVGIITAQSIGEKQTQSNLNSVDWKEKLLYMDQNGDINIRPIGHIIDSLLSKSKPVYIEENRTYYLELDKPFYVPSCDEDGKTGWYRIEAVTKHLPVGELVRVKTASGREVSVTRSKSLIVWRNGKFIPINGSELLIGDFLPVTKKLPKPTNIANSDLLDENLGLLIGLYISCGFSTYKYIGIICQASEKLIHIFKYYNISFLYFSDMYLLEKNDILKHIETICGGLHKSVPKIAYTASDVFTKALLTGIVYKTTNCSKIVLKFINKTLANEVAFLLSYHGIFSKFKTYKEFYFIEVKDLVSYKTQNDVILDPVVSISSIKPTNEYVYDLTVETTRNFMLFNLLTVRDTFHKAGSAEKQPVVSKFSELLNATNKPKAPFYTIYFNKGNSSIGELREMIGNSLVELSVKRISKKTEICIDKKSEKWYDIFEILYGEKEDYFTDCISITVDMDILYEYRLALHEIAKYLSETFEDIYCLFSPDCYGKLDIFFDTRNIELPEDKLFFITKENIREIYLEEVALPVLESSIVCGISGINNIFFIQDGKEWIVHAENISSKKKNKLGNKTVKKIIHSTKKFKQVLGHPAVNMSKTLSNNIWDIYHTLGIEAVRTYMIDEFSQIMEGINICHVTLLVDKMTFNGSICSISRYTMRNEETGPFGKASFEETLDNFLKAGVYGQDEPTRGVSASIICGKRARIGTGFCDITVDIDKLV